MAAVTADEILRRRSAALTFAQLTDRGTGDEFSLGRVLNDEINRGRIRRSGTGFAIEESAFPPSVFRALRLLGDPYA